MLKIEPGQLDLQRFIRAGDGIVMSQATGEPQTLTETLVQQRNALGGVSVFIGSSTFSGTFTAANCDGLKLASYGGASTHRKLIKAGLLEQYPVQVSQIPRYFGDTIPCDVAFVQVGPRRLDGSFSYSLISDYPVDAVLRARVVIAESNAQAPDTVCDVPLREDQITVLVETNRPLIQVPTAKVTELERKLAGHLSAYIPDRATLQIGGGAIPEAIIGILGDRRDLGLHTGVIGDSVLELIDKGVVTNAYKEVDTGISVSGCFWGTDRLYRFVHQNPALRVSRLSHTHSPEVLSKFTCFVSVNSALEVDLTGQVNAEEIGGEYVGAVGGQIDYVRAGSRSVSGASIIALPSMAKEGQVSRIVARLSGPVTTARGEVDVIATEHGAVRLRGRSLKQRVKLMISIADEKFRDGLEKYAHEHGML